MKTRYFLGILVVLLFWWVLSLLVGSEIVLPTPLTVGRTIVNLLAEPNTYVALASTLSKVVVVLLVVVSLGVILGFVIGLNTSIFELLRPVILVVQAVPIITWLALVMFVLGIGWAGPVVVSVLSLLPQAMLLTAVGVRTTDAKLREVAVVYRVTRSKVLRDIYLGSVLPQMVSALHVVIGNVWKVVVVAEYMCGNEGVGVRIAWARQSVAVERVYALTLIVISIGLLAESLVHRFTETLLRDWSVT